jgi:hypothetical protein
MSLLCAIGLHKKVFADKYIPNIEAEVVTEYIFKLYCTRCGKVFHTDHKVWNAETKDYEDKVTDE